MTRRREDEIEQRASEGEREQFIDKQQQLQVDIERHKFVGWYFSFFHFIFIIFSRLPDYSHRVWQSGGRERGAKSPSMSRDRCKK